MGQPPPENQAKEHAHQVFQERSNEGSAVSDRMRQAIECMLDDDPDKRFESIRRIQVFLCPSSWNKLAGRARRSGKKLLGIDFGQGEFATHFPDGDPPRFIAANPDHLLVLASQRGEIRTYLASENQPYGVDHVGARNDKVDLQDLAWISDSQSRSLYYVLALGVRTKIAALWEISGSGGALPAQITTPRQAIQLAHDGDKLFIMGKTRQPDQSRSLESFSLVMPPPDCKLPTDFVATRDAWIVTGTDRSSCDQPLHKIWIMHRLGGTSWQPVEFHADGCIYLAKFTDNKRVYACALDNARCVVGLIEISSGVVQTRLEPGDWPEVRGIAANKDRLFVLGVDACVHWFGHQSLVRYAKKSRNQI